MCGNIAGMSTQEIEIANELLTAKQENFARYFIESGSATTAYRMAYESKGNAHTVQTESYRTLQIPRVAARVAELREIAAAHTIVTAREIMQDWVDQARVDTNELVTVHTFNCRHCNGFRGKFQWVDELELREAVQKWEQLPPKKKARTAAPDAMGGFDFRVRGAVNLDCLQCAGLGVTRSQITDTDKLSPQARKLFKGVKLGPSGLTIELHDAQAARESIAKALGVFTKDMQLNPAAPVKPMAADVTAEDAAAAYLEMVR